MNVLAFGASYHKASINKELASYVAQFFTEGNTIQILDLNDFQLPLFTVDVEAEKGHPELITEFIKRLEWADLLIISMAEHNGAYTAAFKNLFDWTSRVKAQLFENKKLLLLSTSTGERGGKTVLGIAADRFPRHGAEIVETFSLPSFEENFGINEGILNAQLRAELQEKIKKVQQKLP